jgi:hypothetical protein
MLSKPVRNSNGSLTFNILGTPNASSRVLAATNLSPPVSWKPVYTNVAPANGVWQFTDTNASQSRVRYYRTSTP